MPGFREIPAGVQVLATERRALSASMLQYSCYDSVIAAAVAVDNLLESLGGDASGVADLGPEIAGALAAGVQFEALGAYDYRSAKRRRHPKSQAVVKNRGISVSGRRVRTFSFPEYCN